MSEPTEGNAKVIECVGVLETMALTATASVRMRTNFSFHQLMAASRLAREVADVERRNAGQEFGAFYETIFGSSLGCIVLSLAGRRRTSTSCLLTELSTSLPTIGCCWISSGRNTRSNAC